MYIDIVDRLLYAALNNLERLAGGSDDLREIFSSNTKISSCVVFTNGELFASQPDGLI